MEQMRTILLAIITPLIGMAYLALDSTLSYQGIISSYSTVLSGGYGQNQMSSVLGLGMLAAMLYAATGRRQHWFRLTIGGIGIWLGAQALLTLSSSVIMQTSRPHTRWVRSQWGCTFCSKIGRPTAWFV